MFCKSKIKGLHATVVLSGVWVVIYYDSHVVDTIQLFLTTGIRKRYYNTDKFKEDINMKTWIGPSGSSHTNVPIFAKLEIHITLISLYMKSWHVAHIHLNLSLVR